MDGDTRVAIETTYEQEEKSVKLPLKPLKKPFKFITNKQKEKYKDYYERMDLLTIKEICNNNLRNIHSLSEAAKYIFVYYSNYVIKHKIGNISLAKKIIRIYR